MARRGDVARQQSDQGEGDRHAGERGEIERADAIEHRAQRAGGNERHDQPEHAANQNKSHPVTHDQAKHIGPLRAQRHAHTDLMRALDDQK